jgi:hypothetical protein
MMRLMFRVLLVSLLCATGIGAQTKSNTWPGDLDLPVSQPRFGDAPPAPVPDPAEDDPRDEPPPVIYGEEIESETDTIFYVIDISGSMYGDFQSYTTVFGQQATGSRLDRAKAELFRSIQGLSPNFKFNIVAFDCATRLWSQVMQEANESNKIIAAVWTIGLQAGGATGTGPATALALGDKQNHSVVLLTDGAPNCGAFGDDGHRQMIRAANTQGATINVFGIAASGTYRAFCQSVAADSGGSYFDVP